MFAAYGGVVVGAKLDIGERARVFLQHRQARVAVRVDIEVRIFPFPGRVGADYPEAVDIVVVQNREDRPSLEEVRRLSA